MIELTLPWPPSINHSKRVGRIMTTRSGKRYQQRVNTPQTNQFYAAVRVAAYQQCLKSFDSATISVEVDAYPPDRKRRDIDNICKVTLDALQKAGVFKDDYQIARLLVERKAIIKQGQIIVRISHYETNG